jgi:tetratricopeptide (TPR) repeat protein
VTGGAPLKALHQQARQALRGGVTREALSLLGQAIAKTSAREEEYLPALEDLRGALASVGRFREALSIDWYRQRSDLEEKLLERVPPIDRARTHQAWGERAVAGGDRSRAAQCFGAAANGYESCGRNAHAAICHERAGDVGRACALWATLANGLGEAQRRWASPDDRYAAGLAWFNVARTTQTERDSRVARAAMVSAVHCLEEAADRYERIGQRERAFDCYQVLIAIGKRSGELEHVLEGYVNVVRILREDNLRYFALQHYEEAIAVAEEKGELAAAATLASELSTYAAKLGMQSLANFGIEKQAELWQRVATRVLERGGPGEVAENALLAAIVSNARQGRFASVGQLYRTLGEMDLEPSRVAHYRKASERYRGVIDARRESAPLPSHLRQEEAIPDVWHVDLVEWEQAGSAAAACGDVVLDSGQYSEVTRRRALVARLQALRVDEHERPDPLEQVKLIELLGQVELYGILSPLEHAFKSDRPQVRSAVATALERFMYKRSFVTIRAALEDRDAAVREVARATTEQLVFPHAFDPLARIFREEADAGAKAAALKTIARLDTQDAVDLLFGVFQHGAADERAAALEGLRRARGRLFIERAREMLSDLPDASQRELRELFRHRGV